MSWNRLVLCTLTAVLWSSSSPTAKDLLPVTGPRLSMASIQSQVQVGRIPTTLLRRASLGTGPACPPRGACCLSPT